MLRWLDCWADKYYVEKGAAALVIYKKKVVIPSFVKLEKRANGLLER